MLCVTVLSLQELTKSKHRMRLDELMPLCQNITFVLQVETPLHASCMLPWSNTVLSWSVTVRESQAPTPVHWMRVWPPALALLMVMPLHESSPLQTIWHFADGQYMKLLAHELSPEHVTMQVSVESGPPQTKVRSVPGGLASGLHWLSRTQSYTVV
jgi:hypothetical protein